MVEALGEMVPVFKPQSAFFEAYGSAGIAVLERTLADIEAAGALSLLDVKRGDIGSTMDAYAAAYLTDGSPLAADAITLSPYLGFGSLAGAIALADEAGRGVYVLALTSNPEGPQIQHARTPTAVPSARRDRRGGQPQRQSLQAGLRPRPGGRRGRRDHRTDGADFSAAQRLDPCSRASAPRVPLPPTSPTSSAAATQFVLPAMSREMMARAQHRLRCERGDTGAGRDESRHRVGVSSQISD